MSRTYQNNHPKILIASTNENEKRVLSRYLRDKAYRVIYAKNQQDCLTRLHKQVDLLLLDLAMQHWWQILKSAKKNNGNGQDDKIPVVVFDHENNPLKELKAVRLGADGYVGRPQLKEDLLSRIIPFMDRREMEARLQTLIYKEVQKRKSVEQELKRVSFFAENVTSNLPVSILIVDGQKKITYANRNFCRVQGYAERDLRGMPLERLFPESIYGPIGFLEKVEIVLKYHRVIPRFGMQFRGDYYTCRLLPMRAMGRPKTVEDSAQAMILIENVSELRKLGEKVKVTEEKYRVLFESAPDGILVTKAGCGKIFDANHQAKRLLGLKRGGLKRRSLVRFYPPTERGIVRDRCPKQEAPTGVVELPELILDSPSGSHRILTITAASIFYRGERSLFCLLKDITEKRLLEDQVRQGEKMSFLGQFTAGAAHEINNPLAIISSNCQYLLPKLDKTRIKGGDLKELRETLNLIDRESRHCGVIIQNLLAFTHVRGMTKKPVNLVDVVDETLKLVKHQLGFSNIVIKSEMEQSPLSVLGDTNLLQQLLMNLIWNAQAAMPKKGQLIIRANHGQNGTIELKIQDTGCGIPEENLEKIFTPFFTTKEVGKGTGLGLWVVRSIVEEHQGSISVKSKMGKGSQFIVEMPAIDSTTEHSKNNDKP